MSENQQWRKNFKSAIGCKIQIYTKENHWILIRNHTRQKKIKQYLFFFWPCISSQARDQTHATSSDLSHHLWQCQILNHEATRELPSNIFKMTKEKDFNLQFYIQWKHPSKLWRQNTFSDKWKRKNLSTANLDKNLFTVHRRKMIPGRNCDLHNRIKASWKCKIDR